MAKFCLTAAFPRSMAGGTWLWATRSKAMEDTVHPKPISS
jgi:hypothetical protein